MVLPTYLDAPNEALHDLVFAAVLLIIYSSHVLDFHETKTEHWLFLSGIKSYCSQKLRLRSSKNE